MTKLLAWIGALILFPFVAMVVLTAYVIATDKEMWQ